MLLQPFGRAVEASVLIMAMFGLWWLAKNPRSVINDPSVRLFSIVFACAWLPMAASWPDAVAADRTATVVLNHLRFWLSGLFIIRVLAHKHAQDLFFSICTIVLLAWLFDAWFQHATGYDILGYAAYSGRLGAMFGPGNSKFGLTLAVLAPLMWHCVHTRLGNTASVIAMALTIAVVFLAGSRAGWVCVLVAAGSWILLRSALTGKRAVMLILAMLLTFVTVTGLGYTLSDRVKQQIDQSLSIFDSGPQDIHNSLIHRSWIWGAALRMIRQHPVNGVGARGFRVAFADYARDDDPYLKMEPPESPTHSHQLLIEILAETGIIGFAGLLLMFVLLIQSYGRSAASTRAVLAAPAAMLIAAYFPLNTHLAIYSSYWSQIVWFMISLYCALCAGKSILASSSDNA
jgi:O-antigen ligase